MDELKKQTRNPVTMGIAGLVLGLLLGLLIGWVLWPVQWTDATLEELSPAYQTEYLRMSIAEFSCTGDVEVASTQYEELGENGPVLLAELSTDERVNQQDYAAYVMAVAPEEAASIISGTPVAPTDTGGGSTAGVLIPILCGVFVAVGAAAAIFLILRRLPRRQGKETQPETEATQVTPTEQPETAAQPPLAQFMTTYGLGNDQYDDSFSIDSTAGEFLGECGAGISEVIGVGEPKKVTAFEVWLFDKNDIQTVTKVLMSTNAFNDEAIRSRLAAKGEPELIAPGSEIVVETQTLQMVVRVVDMAYGEGPLPPDSFLERLVLELSVWAK
jgi:hypothetical protein